ncbi:toprim domain-containing protein [Candidatus Bathyarchaeota archaeon]|nr:toprim domain-containing protein [Candidatus Bathyarchaeota archaeon]
MSTHLKEKEEQILQILEQLAEENKGGKPILVEGRKDAEALKELGINGQLIFAKTGGKNLLDVISEIEASKTSEVLMLLDFDKRGRELTENLKQHIEKIGVKVNVHFWLRLSSLVRKEVKDVEGLAKYMKTLKRKIGDS